MKALLELRKSRKSRKPNFVRTDSNKEKHKNRLKWRKPRGLHNKLRLKKKGHIKTPSVGYKSPKLVKGLHSSGLSFYLVNNIKDLEGLNKEKQIPIISSKLGLRKKISILEKCLSEKIQVLNVKDINLFLEESKAKIAKKKKESQDKKLEKKKKEEKIEKKKKEEKEKSEDKQEKIKKEVLGSKQDSIKKIKEPTAKVSTVDSKKGHKASSVPGSKQ